MSASENIYGWSALVAVASFLATVSHEIRTPMNGIIGLLSLMSDTSMSRRQRDYVSKISTSANSLLGIIKIPSLFTSTNLILTLMIFFDVSFIR